MKIVVIGAGKMGLPLACQFAHRGAEVTACDVSAAVVAAINAGRCPESVANEPGIPEMLAQQHRAGRLTASTQTAEAVAQAEVVVVIVPGLLTAERDIELGPLSAASKEIARGLKRGTMVSYETTMPVGGTRRLLQPLLEVSGLRAGVDFDLVFSPERVKSQKVLEHLTVNPKVVGGITDAAADRAERFYREYLGAPVTNVRTLEAAEMVKLAGMVYRDVNIALANELSIYAEGMGIDFPSLLSAINSDGEAAILQPGVGVGGHCTPVYPYFLIHDAERRGLPATLATRSRAINDNQAAHVLDRIEKGWRPLKGKRALLLGLAFRPRVKEDAFSTAFLLRDELLRRGAEVALHDPLYSDEEIARHGFRAGSLDGPWDVIVLNTAHPEYADLPWSRLRGSGLGAVVDGRNFWTPADIARHGVHYFGIGKPDPVVAGRSSAVAPQPSMPIARPLLGSQEAEAAARVVRSGWILQGPEVAAFEREFAAFVAGSSHPGNSVEPPFACAVSSGTAALHLALLAVGVEPGDEVITVSHSYIATANSVRYCGAVPVFVDIDPTTLNIDPDRVEAAITPLTRAILCVHQLGTPCDLDTLVPLARRHGLRIVEDAACAAGSEILRNGAYERIGRPHGDIACFSFHPRKILTTGDGGMITTRNPEWDRRMRSLRQHAALSGTPDETFPEVGFNYRMTDIQAAVGRAQLRRLPGLVAQRRQIAAWYADALAGVAGITPPIEPAYARNNWQSYYVRLAGGIDPIRVAKLLAEEGIASRLGIHNAHQQPAYAGHSSRMPLTESERARAQGLILPLYHQMTRADVERVANSLSMVLAGVAAG